MTDEESHKREIRRYRNRQAAEKCKRKRNEIEDKLHQDVQYLNDKHTCLMKGLIDLKNEKQKLEKELLSHECKMHSSYGNNNNVGNVSSVLGGDVNYYQQYQKMNNNNIINNQYVSANNNANQYNDFFIN